MCSVVEIKNLDEYCIRYHSPESLENLDHLVRDRLKVVNINLRDGEEEEEEEIHPLFRRQEQTEESLVSVLENNNQTDTIILQFSKSIPAAEEDKNEPAVAGDIRTKENWDEGIDKEGREDGRMEETAPPKDFERKESNHTLEPKQSTDILPLNQPTGPTTSGENEPPSSSNSVRIVSPVKSKPDKSVDYYPPKPDNSDSRPYSGGDKTVVSRRQENFPEPTSPSLEVTLVASNIRKPGRSFSSAGRTEKQLGTSRGSENLNATISGPGHPGTTGSSQDKAAEPPPEFQNISNYSPGPRKPRRSITPSSLDKPRLSPSQVDHRPKSAPVFTKSKLLAASNSSILSPAPSNSKTSPAPSNSKPSPVPVLSNPRPAPPNYKPTPASTSNKPFAPATQPSEKFKSQSSQAVRLRTISSGAPVDPSPGMKDCSTSPYASDNDERDEDIKKDGRWDASKDQSGVKNKDESEVDSKDEDKGSGFNFGKKWSYLEGNLIISLRK